MKGTGLAAVAAILVFFTLSHVAQAQDEDTVEPGILSLGVEAGWRWVGLGADRIPRDEDTFSMAYHAAVRLQLGAESGLYTYGRFDGYAPTGLGTFPFSAQVRLGWYVNEHYWDEGGPGSSSSRSYTGSSCDGAHCYDHYTTTTYSWWEPAGWVNGLRYFYASGRLISGTEVAEGNEDTRAAGAVSLGFGLIETKFATWFSEFEVLYFPAVDWEEEDRSEWGLYLRGGTLFGPLFIDFTILLDPAVGGELSLGAGFLLGA